MSNPDKHKPLSPEELLKLLDQKSDKTVSFDDTEMDDFEKEALEGFSSYAKNSVDAKRMMDEINVAISEEVGENIEKNRKNKIVWFSAAASLAIIVIISAVFFKQTDVASNIALNEAKEEVTVPIESKDNATLIENSVDELKPKENQTQEPERVLPVETKKVNDYISNNAVGSGSSKGSQAPDVVSGEGDYATLEQKNKTSISEDANYEAVAANTSVSDKLSEKQLDDVRNESLTTDNKKEQEETKKTESAPMKYMDVDLALAKNKAESEAKSKANTEAKQRAKKEAAKADESMAGGVVNTAVPASTGYITNANAYYVGGELGIKNYVVSYLKEHKEVVVLKGKFKVKASVNEKGVLKVNTIENTSNDCKECLEPITKALNSMNNWKSALQNNKSVSSETEFMLFF